MLELNAFDAGVYCFRALSNKIAALDSKNDAMISTLKSVEADRNGAAGRLGAESTWAQIRKYMRESNVKSKSPPAKGSCQNETDLF
jgi:hypothetical protein